MRSLIHAGLAVLALGAATVQGQESRVDARVSTYAQFFQQALLPGQPGMVGRVEPAFPITLSAFARVTEIALPAQNGVVAGELSAWGSLGQLNGRSADGDVTTVWAQYRDQHNHFRVKLGRQVTLPGSSRYVRFDGASLGLTFGALDFDVYGGWVALPRWNLPRGATVLGFVGDALKDPLLLEAQNRVGQITAGARVSVRLPWQSRVALAFHEQRDQVGTAFRVISVDGTSQPLQWLGVGTRVSVDLLAGQASEARAWADITAFKPLPLSFDYSYQKPSLLLPQTSILAAFGGASWHELGAETTVALAPTLKLTARGAGQLFEGAQLGGRGQLRLKWTPDLDGRWLVLADVTRALVPPSGFTQLRAGARWRAAQTITTSLDASVYFYDVPIHDVSVSMTGVASVEWAPQPWVRAMLSATVLRTPYAAFEAQGMARAVFDLAPTSAGGLP